ncbi:MAG: hypothetical protein GWO20_13120 [Candidatus Korarchaeota archaeon]|nr:hypothetical protein [Candidatus Korarchaeota archaeon]
MMELNKAKRRLSDFNFEKEGSHVALVGKHQGGPANGVHTLITKATDKREEEIIKAEVQLKLDIVQFLMRFFNMWSGEAATLAEIFGVDTGFFDDEFSFEEFNSIGASEVTLMKSASQVEKTEESLVAYVETLETEQLNTLKAFAEGFEMKLEEHRNMSEEIQKALDEQKVELEKAQAKLEEVEKAKSDAEAKLQEVEKAKEDAAKAEFVEKAKTVGAEDAEGFGAYMYEVSKSEAGVAILEALEKAHKRLDEVLEKEAGFTGEIEDSESEAPILKAMKAKYDK